MRALSAAGDLDAFLDRVSSTPDRVLMLDYDGTLAPFREARDEAVPYPGVREAVADLVAARHTRVVVVSGRALSDLRPLLAVRPEPEMWGSHGWERYRPDMGEERGDPGIRAKEGLARALAHARAVAPMHSVETKPVSVAVHVRGMDVGAAAELLEKVRSGWSGIARETRLEMHDFDGGVELRVPGRDKGTSVRAILSETPADAVAAFLGDDRTDEDAFRALGGGGLRVLVRSELRETEADLWIQPPEELLEFLDLWNRAANQE
jgi:trehalose 6-phosphate phosphatase